MKELLLKLLALSLCICTGAFLFTACDNGQGSGSRDQDMVSVYNMYVAYAEENGEIPKSYDEWIEYIKGAKGDKGDTGDKGDKGDKGVSIIKVEKTFTDGLVDTYTISFSDESTTTFTITNGAQGDKGDKGDQGIGIKSAVVNEEGNLIITLTNDTTINAGKVKDVHEHDFNEPIYMWTDDYYKCVGMRVCKIDSTHIEMETVTATKQVKQELTCILDEISDLTATFTNSAFTTQKKENITTSIVTGHNYVERVCTKCGQKEPSERLAYTLNDDRLSYSVAGIGGCLDLDVVIPSTYNGLPVTTINNSAFYDCSDISSIEIPDSVTSIGDSAFYNCINLVSITIGKNLVDMGYFSGCPKLVELINKSNINATSYFEENECIDNVFIEKHSGKSEIENHNGYLFITFKNKNYLLGYLGSATELILPDSYKGQSYEIFRYAFEYCSSLTSITIPNSVTCIGREAFNGCNSLKDIYYLGSISEWAQIDGLSQIMITSHDPSIIILSKTLYINNEVVTDVVIEGITEIKPYTFYDCSSLTSVTIPNSVTSIGDSAFDNCSSLTSVTIPGSVTSIGGYAFSGCSKLEYNEYDNGLYLGNSTNKYLVLVKAKSKDITTCNINSNTRFIYGSAFDGCRSLTSITIPNSVTSIGGSAFYGCSSLTSISIPNSVTSIGSYAFCGCSSLTSVTIPGSVTSIGGYAFSGCSKLEYNEYDNGLYLGNSTNKYLVLVKAKSDSSTYEINSKARIICERAFEYCWSLTSLTIPDSVTNIGSYAFYQSGLKNITIGNGLTRIESSTFYFSSLESVIIGNSVTSIGGGAFRYCPLKSIVIPDSVTVIDDGAFFYCSTLQSVTIGKNVTSIGNNAFHCCYRLVEIINNSSLNISKGSFDNGRIGLHALDIHSGESKIVNQNDYLFIAYEGTNYLLGYVGNETELTLPDDYNGESYEIYNKAFAYKSSLTSVIIGNSVTSIGDEAFLDCPLTSVTIGKNVTSISNSAFSFCWRLTNVTFENTRGWTVAVSPDMTNPTYISSSDLADTSTAASYLRSTYYYYYWKRG